MRNVGLVADGGAKPQMRSTDQKSAQDLARRIATEVAGEGWPVGRSLGSEQELLDRYSVGRGVLREAVRLLEHQSVAEMRKGPSGGLVVAEPNLDATVYAVTIHLNRKGLGPLDMIETRKAIENAAIVRAVERLDDKGRQVIEDLLTAEAELGPTASIDETQHFHVVLAGLAHDPAMELFIDVMLQLSRERWDEPRHRRLQADLVADIVRAHRAVGRAMLAGDTERACRAMSRHLDAFRRWMTR